MEVAAAAATVAVLAAVAYTFRERSSEAEVGPASDRRRPATAGAAVASSDGTGSTTPRAKATTAGSSAGLDGEQLKMMAEPCIVVDREDRALRAGSKQECHLLRNIAGPDGIVHRAFSVFLFDRDARLLVQQVRDSCAPSHVQIV